jgi:ankyrin repeat protein
MPSTLLLSSWAPALGLAQPLVQSRPRARASLGRNAAKDGDFATLSRLVGDGWVAAEDRDRRGATALHLCAGHGHVRAAELLLREVSVNDRTGEGATPLHFSVAGMQSRRKRGESNGFGTGGHLGMTELLLANGADPAAATFDGNGIIHWAAWAGGLGLLKLLTEGSIRIMHLSGPAPPRRLSPPEQ